MTRLAERGAQLVRAAVFRLRGARGWGLRAGAAVPRGTPVALYCGELLPVHLADSRPDDSYMFSLDVKKDLLDVRNVYYRLVRFHFNAIEGCELEHFF